ncbi:MAG TPA: hypothetical protein VMH83_02000 [Candidatus Acidoferrum sp.]|nr:hypothetical protein [Candidatus Acidoferrum sp.]
MNKTRLLAAALLALAGGTAFGADNPRDFSGVWQAFASESAGPRGGPEFTAEGKIKVADFNSKYPHMVEPGSWCVPPGMPYTMTAIVSYPIDITQTDKKIAMITEYDDQFRRIWLDGRKIPDDYPNTGMGYSVGHWDGNALVIETKLLTEAMYGRLPRTEDTAVVEHVSKIKRSDVKLPNSPVAKHKSIDDNVLAWEITTTDPTLYAKPIKTTIYYQHVDDEAMLEYVCITDLWQQALDAANKK